MSSAYIFTLGFYVRVADTLGDIIALFNAQPLCVTVSDDESDYLGINLSSRLSFYRFCPLII